MALPTLIVELSLAQPSDTPVWTDITADVQAVTTSRGRQRELDRYQAGTFTVTLDNRDADYDPNNGASPYAGHIKPMRRIRVRATHDAVTHPIIDGYIDSIDQEYEGPNVARAVISATDAFKVLAAAELPPSVYAAEVVGSAPDHWWRLDELTGATVAYDSVGDADAAVQGASVVMGDLSLISRDPGAAMTGVAIGDNIRIPGGVIPATGAFTVEFVIDTAAGPSFRGRVLGQVGDSGFEVGIASTFTGIAPPYMWIGGSDIAADYSAGSDVSTETPRHVVALREAGGTMRLYVNGVEVSGTQTGAGTDAVPSGELDFGTQRLSIEDVVFGTFDELAIYHRALTADEIAAHAAAVATPWNDDLPGPRAARILDLAAWDATRRDLDDGVTTLQSATLEVTALEHLQKVAETELGALFVTADGDVRLIARHALRNLAELYTLSDDPVAGGHLPYRNLRPEYGDALIRNEVTVSRSEGIAQTVRDEASIAEYLTHSYVLEGLLHDDDTHSRYAAQYIAAEYAEPVRRISQLVVSPLEADHTDDLFTAVLTLELADEVTVIERPPGGITITQDSVIEGIAHTIGPGFWQTTYQLSPAGTDAYWQIGIAGASEIGVTTRVGF